MTSQRMLRFEDRASLVEQTASLLLDSMSARQASAGSVSLCLTGGDLANQVLDHIAADAASTPLKPGKVHLWWNWDLFVATDNPDRNSQQALSRLAGSMSLDPAKIHPIPSSSVASDPEAGAAQYAQELKDNSPIDICLLQLCPNGQIAGIFPHHLNPPSLSLVAGITDAPLDHPELITMTRLGLNSCRQVWILASGEDVAPVLKRACDHDPSLPASYVTGKDSVRWLIDSAAASYLPFHHCTL